MPNKIPDQVLAEIARKFELGSIVKTCRLGGLANENYQIETRDGSYVVKINKRRRADDVGAEFLYLEHLKQYGVPVPEYLTTRSGDVVFEYGGGVAFVMNTAPSTIPAKHASNVNLPSAAVAKIHTVPMKDFQPRRDWTGRAFVDSSLTKLVKKIGAVRTSKYQIAAERLNDIIHIDVPSSIIHGDVRLGNCLFDRNKLSAIVDWEKVTIGPSIVDLASMIATTSIIDNKTDLDLFSAMIEGYQNVRDLTPQERDCLPDFVRFSAPNICLWVALIHGDDLDGSELGWWANMYWVIDLDNWTVPSGYRQ